MAQTGRQSADGAAAGTLFRPESRVWGKPVVVSTVNPAAFNSGPFTQVKAQSYLPRPGISGAAWETTMKGPRREMEEFPSLLEGVSVFGTHEMLIPPSRRGRTPPGFPSGGYGGGGGGQIDGVHYRITRASCISGKLRRKYSPQRPPTPIRRLQELEAKRRAEASARADVLVIDYCSDKDAPSARPSRPATRGSRRTTSRVPSAEQHRVRIADASDGDLSIDVGVVEDSSERIHHEGLKHSPKSTLSQKPIKQRLQEFSHALTVKFPKAVDAFAVIDSDGSGSLSIKELAEGLTALGIEIDEPSLKELMDSAGLSTKSMIKYKDFLQLFLGKFTPITEEQRQAKALAEAQELLIRKISKPSGEIDHDDLLKAFQSFDDNGDGWIDNDELRRGFRTFGLGDIDDPNSKMAPFLKLINECDDNGDGKINYKEFLDLAGFDGGGRRDFDHRSIKGGGAAQGFRELNKFDAKILERERLKRAMSSDLVMEPDTPTGLARWRAKYAKSFFGSKYVTDMEREAKQLVADKAEGRYVEPVLPWSIATRRYMEQVLKVPPESDNPLLYKGIQTLIAEQDETTWNSTTHDNQTSAFRTKARSVIPALERVDGTGNNYGNSIPRLLPGVRRQTGAFRQTMILNSEWDEIKDQAVRSSLRLTHDHAVRPRYLHDPPFVAELRQKTVKDVVYDYNEENQIDFSNTVSLRGPVDVHSPFSRFGGQWTLHDSVEGIIHKSHGDTTRPPAPTGIRKPMVQAPEITAKQVEEKRLRGGEEEPVLGKTTTQLDANSFMSQPMQRDLFCRTLLNSGKRTPAPPKRSVPDPLSSPLRELLDRAIPPRSVLGSTKEKRRMLNEGPRRRARRGQE